MACGPSFALRVSGGGYVEVAGDLRRQLPGWR
jgi:hypothetical protein